MPSRIPATEAPPEPTTLPPNLTPATPLHKPTPKLQQQLPSPKPMAGNQTDSLGRILLFVTSHLSHQHITWLKCWPDRVWPKLPRLLQHADVMMYVGTRNQSAQAQRLMANLLAAWPNARKRVHFDDNPGYQRGAMKALGVAVSKGWFEEYAWIIRINPDVLIYDEGPLLALMQQTHTWAVFANCRRTCSTSGCKHGFVHTDFFAVRPSRMQKDAFTDWRRYSGGEGSAEMQATRTFQNIVNAGAEAWLQPHKEGNGCRVRFHGLWHEQSSCEHVLAKKPWLKRKP